MCHLCRARGAFTGAFNARSRARAAIDVTVVDWLPLGSFAAFAATTAADAVAHIVVVGPAAY